MSVFSIKKAIIQVEELEVLLQLHIKHKKDAGYTDSGDDITRKLIEQGNITGFCIRTEEQGILAFIMVVRHGTGATYYIGWCNELGYRYNLNKCVGTIYRYHKHNIPT